MSPYTTTDYPLWAEHTVRATRTLMYFFSAVTGMAALVFTPASLKPETFIIVGSMLVFGGLCLIGTITRQYLIEWISLFFLTAGISTYAISVWITALVNVKVIAGASVFTVLVLLMLIRLLDLTVYWLRNVKTAKLSLDIDNVC